jgi:DNA-binding GntR family transcriptional regulator
MELYSFERRAFMTRTRVRGVERIHLELRAAIMSGDYEPGTVLSQVELARNFGVSRTPLREAIRRLEAEGLIESLQNQRTRVASIDAESLDVLFTERILVEAMGIKVTVPHMTEVDLNSVLAATAALRVALESRDAGAEAQARRSLHQCYVARAGERLRSAIGDQFDLCERYRRRYLDLPTFMIDDYTAIASACIRRNGDDACRRIARLEVQVAEAVLRRLNADYKPTAIRTALQMLEGAGWQ